ncbi:MAG: YfhO family protein [Oscillospiraceae bacterium]|jgi:uncharacterized membrane protein YfhO|nr:YfhO family protein [Oscillospiraceae bacterium]
MYKRPLQSIARFDKKSARNKRIVYYCAYTLVFILMASLAFSFFFLRNKGFIWNPDGISQHANSLRYYGTYLRQVVRTFFQSGSLTFPLWDFGIGFGADILTTLHYYVIGDPLNLLTALVPAAKTEILYSALVLLRLFLAGFAFSAYCKKMNRGRFATLCGALSYTFCGYVLFATVRHPYFANPMIYLPLLLIGVEKIFAKEKPYVFILTVFVSAVSNFYFFYVLCLLVVIYACIRFFSLYRSHRVKNALIWAGKFFAYALVGVLMSGAILLPVIALFTSAGRAATEHHVGLFYPLLYYARFLSRFLTGAPGFWTRMNYCAWLLLSIFLLFSKKRRLQYHKIAFVLLTLFLLFPVFGHIFNGFSYVSNRWIFGYSFLLSLLFVYLIPEFLQIEKKQLRALAIASLLFLVVLLCVWDVHEGSFIPAYGFVLLNLAALFFLYRRRKRGKKTGRVLPYTLVTALLICSLTLHAVGLYSPDFSNYITEFFYNGELTNWVQTSAAHHISEFDDDTFYRFEENRCEQDIFKNGTLNSRAYSTGYYFSLNNGAVSQFMAEIQNNARLTGEAEYIGFDNRAIPAALANVKYYVVEESLQQYLPYGYTNLVKTFAWRGNTFCIYENDYALPFGYTYSSILDRTAYEALSPVQKQAALLQSAVVDLPEVPDSFATGLRLQDRSVPYEMIPDAAISLQAGKIIVKEPDAILTLRFNGYSQCETYLRVTNLQYTSVSARQYKTDAQWETLSGKEQRALLGGKVWEPAKATTLFIQSGEVRKRLSFATPDFQFYIGKHDFLINLGYSEGNPNELTIKFPETGEFTFDSLELISQPMDEMAGRIAALKEDVLENVRMEENRVSGTIALDSQKLLCLSIPYSDGWSATVDGKSAGVLQTNTMYCGLLLEPGTHEIVLLYRTPYLTAGILCSLAGLALFTLLVVYRVRKKRRI